MNRLPPNSWNTRTNSGGHLRDRVLRSDGQQQEGEEISPALGDGVRHGALRGHVCRQAQQLQVADARSSSEQEQRDEALEVTVAGREGDGEAHQAREITVDVLR